MSYTINLKAKQAHSVKSPTGPVLLMLPRFLVQCFNPFITPLPLGLSNGSSVTGRGRQHQIRRPTEFHLIPAVQYLPTFNKTNTKNYLTCAWKHPAANLRLRTRLGIGPSVLPHGHSVVGQRQARKEGAPQPAWCFGREHTDSWVWCGETSVTNKFL